ncbi:hypothetical protein ACUH88_00155 [Dermabacteraceae bacterium P13095]
MKETWTDWVKRVSGDDSIREIGRKTSLSPSTVARWKTVIPNAETVIIVCRAYSRPIIEGLYIAGYVTAEEADIGIQRAQWLESDELLRELGRRLQNSERRAAPADILKASVPSAKITSITSVADFGEDLDLNDLSLAAGDADDNPSGN